MDICEKKSKCKTKTIDFYYNALTHLATLPWSIIKHYQGHLMHMDLKKRPAVRYMKGQNWSTCRCTPAFAVMWSHVPLVSAQACFVFLDMTTFSVLLSMASIDSLQLNIDDGLFIKGTSTDISRTVFRKETPTQVFSCEFCELFKNSYFVEDLQTTGSETLVWGSLFNKNARVTAWRPLTVLERDSSTGISLWILWNF